jgi:hypothetical protein
MLKDISIILDRTRSVVSFRIVGATSGLVQYVSAITLQDPSTRKKPVPCIGFEIDTSVRFGADAKRTESDEKFNAWVIGEIENTFTAANIKIDRQKIAV